MCRSKGAHLVETDQDESRSERHVYSSHDDNDEFFIDTVTNVDSVTKKEWKTTVDVEDTKISYKLDTGSEINAIPKSMSVRHFKHMKVKPCKARLVGYFGKTVRSCGQVVLQVLYKNRYYPVTFMIVDSDTTKPILGL